MLIAALKIKDKNLKSRGKARLTSMLKSGNALEIFSVKESDLKQFMQGAKQYGIVYRVLRNTQNKSDGLCDIMVKADDTPKISRLVERFKLATVDKAKIQSEIVTEKAEKTTDIGDHERLIDDFLGVEGKVTKEQEDNRSFTKGGKPPKIHPSEPTLVQNKQHRHS